MSLIEGIVINTRKIKDDDLVVEVLTRSGLVSFFVFNLQKYNYLPIKEFTRAQFALRSGKGSLLVFEDGEIIEDYLFYEYLEMFYSFMTFKEVILKSSMALSLEDSQNLYETTCEFFKWSLENPTQCLYGLEISLIRYFHQLGYGFNTDGCCFCKDRKHIVGYDLTHKGLICETCFREYTSTYLKGDYIYAFVELMEGANVNTIERVPERAIQLQLFDDVIYLFENEFNYEIRSAVAFKNYLKIKEKEIYEKRVRI